MSRVLRGRLLLPYLIPWLFKDEFMLLFILVESPKSKEKPVAFDVILKPATTESPSLRPKSPPKERPVSQEFIEQKLKQAEEKRKVCFTLICFLPCS